MRNYITLAVPCILTLHFAYSYNAIKMAQLDNMIPSGIIICDSLPGLSSSVKFPGLYNGSGKSKLSAGIFNNGDFEEIRLNYPETQYDENRRLFAESKPFIAAEKSFPGLSSGIYIGNFSKNSITHNASGIEDSVRSLEKSNLKLNGAVWVASKKKYIRGFSLWAEQDYQSRTAHTAKIDEFKKIHTRYEHERKYGKGLFTGAFSFFDNHFSIMRFGYSFENVTAMEKRMDTLYFTNRNFVTSLENYDDSFEKDRFDFEIGHIIKREGYNFGLMAGGNSTNIEYAEDLKDSSIIFLNCFFTKEFRFNSLLMYTGGYLSFSNTLYTEDNDWDGYKKLITEFGVDNMGQSIKLKAPLFGMASISDKFKIMAGIEAIYGTQKKYYDFNSGKYNKAKKDGFDLILYPVNFIYNPDQRVMLSISPKIEKDIITGSMELTFNF